MSTAANVSAPRATTATSIPQLSKRALDELKKGATVKVWAQRTPYKMEGAGDQKVEDKEILCSVPTALVRHFSGRCKRELAVNDRKRVVVPFVKAPTQLVVSWMMAGGGNNLGTPDVPYPKIELKNLVILKRLAEYLEIDSLAKHIQKDIAAVPPALPPLPSASSVPNPSAKKAAPVERRICHFCNKQGHIKRDCQERNALFVNNTMGPIFSMRGTAPAAATSGMYSKASNVHARALRRFEADPEQPDPAIEGSIQPDPAKAGSTEPVSTKVKLIPFYGHIKAKDRQGWMYELDWRHIELEIDWLETGGLCKVTGTANLSSW